MSVQYPVFWPSPTGWNKPARTAAALLARSGKGRLVQDLPVLDLWARHVCDATAKLNQDQPA
jgi:hypothetical protein